MIDWGRIFEFVVAAVLSEIIFLVVIAALGFATRGEASAAVFADLHRESQDEPTDTV